MLFNSFVFIFLFLPITLIVYFSLNHFKKEKTAKAWLVLASLYFYAFFNPSYLWIILSSIVVNYLVGQQLHNTNYSDGRRRFIVTLGVLFNVGLLGYFKYCDFFIENINAVFSTNIALINILLPLGISFFTFQQLSFVIDSYRRTSLQYDFLSYCLFVTYFPQLIAGPIVLPTEMLPQFEARSNKRINYDNLNKGLYIFAIGLAKKILIADNIANFANSGFDKMTELSCLEAWLTSVSYTLQLYFDFSGYCDMAIGIGLMFNIKLPINFNSPYKATNFQDFWKRWHMTLGRFMTNYLYIPLGGNRKGGNRTLINLLIVFLVSGIWHGAGWGFIIWGMLHGIAILIHRIWKNLDLRMPKLLGWAITLFFVNIFWIFFRAENLDEAFKVINAMFDFSIESMSSITKDFGQDPSKMLIRREIFTLLCVAAGIVFFAKNSVERTARFQTKYLQATEIIIYLFVSTLLITKTATFLYWNF